MQRSRFTLRRARIIAIGRLVSGVFALGAGYWYIADHKKQPLQAPLAEAPRMLSAINPSNAIGNYSVQQSGGTLNQTIINPAPSKLDFSSFLADEVISSLSNEKPIHLTVVGSSKWTSSVGEQYADYFDANSRLTEYRQIGMYIPAPEAKISVREGPNFWSVMLAPEVP